jgi:hypothetical protein
LPDRTRLGWKRRRQPAAWHSSNASGETGRTAAR